MIHNPKKFDFTATLSYYSQVSAAGALRSEATSLREYAHRLEDPDFELPFATSPKLLRESADQLEAFAAIIAAAKPN